MVNDENYFSTVSDLDNVINISIAKENHFLSVSRIGNNNIKLNSINEIIPMNDVLFIKDLRQNLLSVQKLEKMV